MLSSDVARSTSLTPLVGVPLLVRLPGRHLSSSTACWSPLSPIFKRHRSFHAPTVRCRAQLLVQRPPLTPDCLLVAPTTYSTPPQPLFKPKSSLLPVASIIERRRRLSAPTATSRTRLLAGHHCHFLSSRTARSTPPPPFFESDRSLYGLTRSMTLLYVVKHRRFFLSSSACLSCLPVSSTGDMTPVS